PGRGAHPAIHRRRSEPAVGARLERAAGRAVGEARALSGREARDGAVDVRARLVVARATAAGAVAADGVDAAARAVDGAVGRALRVARARLSERDERLARRSDGLPARWPGA